MKVYEAASPAHAPSHPYYTARLHPCCSVFWLPLSRQTWTLCRIHMPRKFLCQDVNSLSCHGKIQDVFLAAEADYRNGFHITRDIIHFLLQASLRKKYVETVRKAHAFMVAVDFAWIPVLGDHLIRLFSSLGCWLEASLVFSQINEPTVYTWNALMEAHSNSAKDYHSIVLYYEMQRSGINADEVSFLHILKTCSSLTAAIRGMLVHHQVVCSEFQVRNMSIGNALVNLYAKCSCFDEARRVFDTLPNKDVISWGALFSGYFLHGHSLSSLRLYEEMKTQEIKPSKAAFLSVLKACGNMEAIEEGKLIHDKLARTELLSDVGIGNTLVEMYVNCKCLTDAYKVFMELPFQDMSSWTALITGFYIEGYEDFALELFDQLLQKRLKLNRGLCLCILSVCACQEKTDIVYAKLIVNGYEQDMAVGCALVDVYGRLNLCREAGNIFERLNSDGLTWSKIISSYSVLYLSNFINFEEIQLGKFLLDHILDTCSQNVALKHGQFLHDLILKSELAFDIHLNYSLIIMYLKCLCCDDAHRVFFRLQCQTARLWHPIIREYIEEGYDKIALAHIMKMQDKGIQPGKTSFLALLELSMDLGSSDIACFVHHQAIRMGLESDREIGNILVKAYARFGDLDKAFEVFDLLPFPDSRSYRTVTANRAQDEQNRYALEIYIKMQENNVKAEESTVAEVLNACGKLGSPSLGRLLHYSITVDNILLNVLMGTNLVDMYCRLGEIEDAHAVFIALPEHSAVSWSVLITGYIQHGHELFALQAYEKMQEKIKPDEITLSCIIKACANLGALESGRLLNDHVIRCELESNIVIGSILVDMYAKSASLNDACSVFESLPIRNVITWGALISGYALEGDAIGACRCLVNMEKQGVTPDSAIFSNLLTACSHAGFVEFGCHFFHRIQGTYNVAPTTKHYNCMINILGRSGCLKEAIDLLYTMPYLPEIIGWKSLLYGCKAYGNATIGKQCFNY